jgi:phosphoribosylformimino-5-aminoimidazole carboxamide ribotide isomerase
MRIVPVLDLKDGVVVRGIAGRREDYRPIVSRLTKSCRPVDVARAFRDQLGFQEMYLADLDAIAGEPPALETYSEIRALGGELWVDAGITNPDSAGDLVQNGIDHIVVGLETTPGPTCLEEICRTWGPRRVIFSLDLKDGSPLGDAVAWGRREAMSIARDAIDIGVRRIIVLDLARVGTGHGLGTEELCQDLSSHYPSVEIVAGGGVRDEEDLRRLQGRGISAVLVASALHEGRIGSGVRNQESGVGSQ